MYKMGMIIGPNSCGCGDEENEGMHINLFFNLKDTQIILVVKITLASDQPFPTSLFITSTYFSALV